jgi:hypothetical protein
LPENQYEIDYKIYSEYRKTLADIEQKVSDGLDKAILGISSAALGFSVTLYKSQESIFSTSVSFKTSILLFCISLCCVIVSQLLASYLCAQYRGNADKIIENRLTLLKEIQNTGIATTEELNFNHHYKLKLTNNAFHYGAGVILAISISFFSYSILNIYSGAKDETKKEETQITREASDTRSNTTHNSSASTAATTTIQTTQKTVKMENLEMTKPVFIPNQAPPPPPPPTKPR